MVKFKVGDKVKLISDNPKYGLGDIEKGDIGTVKSIYDDELVIDFLKQDDWRGVEEEFELVEEGTEEQEESV